MNFQTKLIQACLDVFIKEFSEQAIKYIINSTKTYIDRAIKRGEEIETCLHSQHKDGDK